MIRPHGCICLREMGGATENNLPCPVHPRHRRPGFMYLRTAGTGTYFDPPNTFVAKRFISSVQVCPLSLFLPGRGPKDRPVDFHVVRVVAGGETFYGPLYGEIQGALDLAAACMESP